VNGAAQLIAALMKAQKQKQLAQQLQNTGQAQGTGPGSVTPMYPDQGQTTSMPGNVGSVSNYQGG
jgi:hypothetical protein